VSLSFLLSLGALTSLTEDSRRDSSIAPYSMSGHEDVTMANDGYGGDMYDEGNPHDVNMTRLQIFMSRSIGGWPLYAIVISFGQLLSAVSTNIHHIDGVLLTCRRPHSSSVCSAVPTRKHRLICTSFVRSSSLRQSRGTPSSE
jgi:alpha-1,3-glucan synthase